MRAKTDFPATPEAEMAARHARVATLMEKERLDAVLVYGTGRFSSEVYWLTDWPGSREAYVLLEPGRDPVIVMQLYNHVPMARVMARRCEVRWAGASTPASVAALLAERGLGAKRIGLVGAVPWRHYLALRDRLSGGEIEDSGGAWRMMRTIRGPEEIRRLRIASQLTDASMQAIKEGLRPGMREDEIPALIEPVYLARGGYAGIHFMSSMPMGAPDFPVPAQYQSSRALARGDCLITEISGGWWGYTGQIHRSFSLGEGPTPEWRKLHDVAVEVFEAIVATIKDGATSRDVEEVADLVHARGYTIYDDLLHGTSQSPPIIQTAKTKRHANRDVTFRENMTITVQPNVCTEDETMGLQFGESFIVGKEGLEPLNHFPREWITCA